MIPTAFRLSPDLVWDELAGEAVIVSPRQAKTYVLNSTGAYVWSRCDGRTSLEQIVSELAQAPGGEATAVRSATQDFCAALQTRGLLQESPLEAPAQPAQRFAAPYVAPRVNLEELADKPNQRPGKRDIGGSRP